MLLVDKTDLYVWIKVDIHRFYDVFKLLKWIMQKIYWNMCDSVLHGVFLNNGIVIAEENQDGNAESLLYFFMRGKDNGYFKQ